MNDDKPEITYLEGGRMTVPDFGPRKSNVRLEVRCCCDAGKLIGWVDVPIDDLRSVIARKEIILRQFDTCVDAAFARKESHPLSSRRTHKAEIALEVAEIINNTTWGRERYYAIKSHDVPIKELTRVPNFRPAQAHAMPGLVKPGLAGMEVTGFLFDEYDFVHKCALCDKLLPIGYDHRTCEECVASGKLL